VPSTSHLLTFAAAAFILIVIPGPSVLFTIGRALSAGPRAAIFSVTGNTLGASVPLIAVALGLGAVVAASVTLLLIVKLAGAAYLIYLGVQAVRERKSLVTALQSRAEAATQSRRVFRQGFLVGMTNPKTIVFFAAVLPQFTDASTGHLPVQILVLGAVFLLIALVSDSIWGFVAGTARNWFARSPRRLEMVGGAGGLMVIGLGASVAVSTTKD
jgi:threonine/homoserine/homoserine lactone efflux protein